MKSGKRKAETTQGLSLIEVLLVIVILTGALYLTLALYIRGFGVLEANGRRLQAVQRLQAELERLRVTPYASLPPEEHRLSPGNPPVPVALGHAPLPDFGLTVRQMDGSPGPTPTAVDPARGRLLFAPPPAPGTVLITYTYAPPSPPPSEGRWQTEKEGLNRSEMENQASETGDLGMGVTVTGTYLNEALQPVIGWAPRKRLTVTVAWTAQGKEHRIQGDLLRIP